MKKNQRFVFILTMCIIFLGCFYFVSCKGKQVSSTFKIGAVMPLTGPIAYLGKQEQIGIQVAVEDLNKQGGIDGKKVAAIFEDSKGDVATAVTSAQKLISIDNVDVLFVTTSKAVRAIIPLTEKADIPLLAMASDPDLAVLGNKVFRIYMNFDEEQRTLANYLATKGYKKLFILRSVDQAYEIAARALETYTKQLGITIEGQETFQITQKDFREILIKAEKSKADVLVLLGYGTEFPQLVAQAKEMNLSKKKHIVGGYTFLSAGARNTNLSLYDGIEFVSFGRTLQDKETQKLIKRFPSDVVPTDFVDYLYAYDSIMFLKQAGVNIKSGNDLSSRLSKITEYNGLTGRIPIKNRDGVVPLAIAKYGKDGKATIIWRPSAE